MITYPVVRLQVSRLLATGPSQRLTHNPMPLRQEIRRISPKIPVIPAESTLMQVPN